MPAFLPVTGPWPRPLPLSGNGVARYIRHPLSGPERCAARLVVVRESRAADLNGTVRIAVAPRGGREIAAGAHPASGRRPRFPAWGSGQMSGHDDRPAAQCPGGEPAIRLGCLVEAEPFGRDIQDSGVREIDQFDQFGPGTPIR